MVSNELSIAMIIFEILGVLLTINNTNVIITLYETLTTEYQIEPHFRTETQRKYATRDAHDARMFAIKMINSIKSNQCFENRLVF